jgi:uncharacterized tellurite resistance protein B-like protein
MRSINDHLYLPAMSAIMSGRRMDRRRKTDMSILKFLGLKSDPSGAPSGDAAETATVRKIIAELDHLDQEQARYVAAFAYVLSRVAHADLKISDEETRVMERIVTDVGGLPESQALIVVQMAKTQTLIFGGTENYLVTREFNRLADRDKKLALLRCLFAVSAADDHVSTAEDAVIRKIANEMLLDHKDFIAVRREFRDQLGVLKSENDA